MKSPADGYSDKNNNNNRYRIVNADAATILKHIKDSNYGDHSLLVYSNLEQFEEFYIECCKDSILKRNEIFVLCTHRQPISTVREKMYQAGIDAARYENESTLVILDSEMAYVSTWEQDVRDKVVAADFMNLISILTRQVYEYNKKGITLLSDPGVFFLSNRIVELISYELSLPTRLDINIRAFCCYHRDDFKLLQEEQRKGIFEHHSNNLIVS
jgi:MEDS: MEthanogen/methylotroph, DcmR Sensory domain